MLVIMESIVLCFILLLICTIGISNGPIGLVIFYENDVQERVVELKLTTKEDIKKRKIVVMIALFLPMLFLTPAMVYFVNGARTFAEIFGQITAIFLIMGLFDRLFIDWYWVGYTKAWLIPGTENLKPYISKKTLIKKWLSTLIGYPLLALIITWIMEIL